MGREKRISKKIGRAYLIILSNLFFHFFPMWHLIGQQRIKLFGVILMCQMTKFMGNDVFNWSCMVNVYLKEDKCFREHSDRRRKIFIFANCMTQNKGKTIMVIDNEILDSLTARAQASPRLRMNLNFHQSLDERCHRFLNAVEPGANIPVHRHPEKEESFVVLRGRVRVITYNDDGTVIENIVLNPSEGRYGVNVGKNVWHTVEALEPGSVIFECKEGPFVEHEEEGILVVDS